MIKTFAIKFLVFIVRIYITLSFWAVFLILILDFFKININSYTWTFIIVTILIFPFRLIKKAEHLRIYLYFLFVATFLTIPIPDVQFLDRFRNLTTNDVLLSILFFIPLILNFYFVYLYYQHRLDSKKLNPFIGKKTYFILLKFAPVFLLIFTVWFLYFFLDIRTTPEGKQYVSLLPYVPSAVPDFTREALNGGYQLSSLFTLERHYPKVIITKATITGDDFIELYENHKKIYKIDFNQQGVKSVVSFDGKGESHEIELYKGKNYGRDKQGKFVEVEENQEGSAINNLDLIVSRDYYFSYFTDSKGNKTAKLDKLELNVYKSINYPHGIHFFLYPFTRSKLDWNLTLKDSRGEIPLVNKILIWY